MKKNFFRICAVCLTVVLAGCLDDDKYALDPSGSENILEFTDISVPASPFGAVHPLYVTAFSVSPEATLTTVISFSGPNSNNKNIDLMLDIDPLAVEAYNAQQGTAYEVLPEELYDIASMEVTLPKGKTKLDVPVTIYPEDFDLSKNYVLPLRIASSSSGTLSSVYSTALFAVVVKNKYDGIYTIGTGSMVDVTNGAFSGIYPKVISLRTIDAVTVNYYDEDYHLDGHIFFTGTGASYYGGFKAQFKFDGLAAASNAVVSVVNGFGQGNNNRFGKLDPAQTPAPAMTFEADLTTPNTMTVWYIMRQINTGVDRTFWKETYTYVEPRP